MNGFDDFDTQVQCDEMEYFLEEFAGKTEFSFEDLTTEEIAEFNSFLDEIELGFARVRI